MNGDSQMNQLPIADRPSKGPTLGIVIIVILIIIGGIYILASRSGEPIPPGETPAPTDGPAGPERGDGAGAVTAPEDVSDLEAEAAALKTDLQTLDQEAAQ